MKEMREEKEKEVNNGRDGEKSEDDGEEALQAM